MIFRSRDLVDLAANRITAEELAAALKNKDKAASAQVGKDLLTAAGELGLPVVDYIRLAVDPYRGDRAKNVNTDAKFDGWDLLKMELALPVTNDFANGIVLQAAGETFQTFPGVRALFPQVIDDLVRFKYRQDQFETTAPFLANSRTIAGPEMLSTVVEDGDSGAKTAYDVVTMVAELGRVPIYSIRASEYAVKIWKFGMGYRLSYEFSRRASIDIVTPYANRVRRAIELGKVKAATNTLINGDGAYGAAPVVTQSSLVSGSGQTTAAGNINFEAFLTWLVSRAKLGTPVDTVVGNWDMFLRWQLMFAKPSLASGITPGSAMQAIANVGPASIPGLDLSVKFALSSTAPANKLIGLSKADTCEELIEANSQIEDSQKAIETQSITYVMSENAGYHLVFGDTRSIFNADAVA